MSLRALPSALTLLCAAAACSPSSKGRLETAQANVAADSTGRSDTEAPATPAKPNERMQAVLDQLAALHPRPITELPAPVARKQPSPADAVKALLQKQGKSTGPEPVGSVVNRTLPGAGGPIPIRIYTPKGAGPFPVVVYYHGGGWVIANLDTYDASPRAMVNLANAAHQDAFTAYRWVLANAKSLKGDPSKVAVMGESAGGNLAAAVSMMARDSGAQLPVYQVLVYPIAGSDVNTPSYQENADAKPLNKPMMEWFFHQYLRTPEDGKNPLIDLVNADLKGLPAATVITDQIDPLRSEGKELADRLSQAGAEVDYENYDGVTHEFFGMGSVVDAAKEAEQQAADGLRKGFGSATTATSQR